MKDPIDDLIARNKAAHVTRDGRGSSTWEKQDTTFINLDTASREKHVRRATEDAVERRKLVEQWRKKA